MMIYHSKAYIYRPEKWAVIFLRLKMNNEDLQQKYDSLVREYCRLMDENRKLKGDKNYQEITGVHLNGRGYLKMIVNLDRFTTFDNLLNEILSERSKQRERNNINGYFYVDYISDKYKVRFQRIYLNEIAADQIKDDIREIYSEYIRL